MRSSGALISLLPQKQTKIPNYCSMDTFIQFFNNQENLLLIYLLIFTVILGFEVISNVPTVLHTPLMSGANAI